MEASLSLKTCKLWGLAILKNVKEPAMLQRKIYDKLVAWKSTSNGSTALLIEGARRVGKSTVAEAFARAEYDTYLLVDFTRVTAEFKRMFLDLRTDLDEFFLYLSAYFGVQLIERRSLVIFDEVQLFPQAREFIKHLVADGRFDYVETGSLISLRTDVQDILLPSEEESVFMGLSTSRSFSGGWARSRSRP